MILKGKKHHWYGVRRSREDNPHWKGGKYVNHSGYVMVYDPEHPRAAQNGYVREHIVMAESALGKPLPNNAQVHHFINPGDNSALVICEDQQYHYLLHIRQRAMEACGNPDYRKCKYCHQWDSVDNLFHRQSKPHGWNTYHYECARDYDRKRYAGKRYSK